MTFACSFPNVLFPLPTSSCHIAPSPFHPSTLQAPMSLTHPPSFLPQCPLPSPPFLLQCPLPPPLFLPQCPFPSPLPVPMALTHFTSHPFPALMPLTLSIVIPAPTHQYSFYDICLYIPSPFTPSLSHFNLFSLPPPYSRRHPDPKYSLKSLLFNPYCHSPLPLPSSPSFLLPPLRPPTPPTLLTPTTFVFFHSFTPIPPSPTHARPQHSFRPPRP